MAIVTGYDVHRNQITFDALDSKTGEVSRGKIEATADAVRAWVGRFPGQEVHVAVEACTGWLFVCEALTAAGAVAHLAEPAETAARRGKKRRAKTDRADARHLRELLAAGRLPEAWIPPAHVREWRTRTRLRKTLVDERNHWLQRIQATLFHHGIPAAALPTRLLSPAGRERLRELPLPAAARERIEVALALIDAIEGQLEPLEREIRALARRQTGCKALMRHFGIGELTAPTILCELGDVSRLSASRKAVRAVGLDIGVHRSDRRSRPGKLTRQGPPAARWALYEAAQSACRKTSPDHNAYLELKARGLSPHPRLADDRKATHPPLLPHPPRTRTGRTRTPSRLTDANQPDRTRAPRPANDGPHPSGQLPHCSRPPPHSGCPQKTERPESSPADRPIHHHVADTTVAHPDKPGRPRSDRSQPHHPQPLPTQLDRRPMLR
jgi:transposase